MVLSNLTIVNLLHISLSNLAHPARPPPDILTFIMSVLWIIPYSPALSILRGLRFRFCRVSPALVCEDIMKLKRAGPADEDLTSSNEPGIGSPMGNGDSGTDLKCVQIRWTEMDVRGECIFFALFPNRSFSLLPWVQCPCLFAKNYILILRVSANVSQWTLKMFANVCLLCLLFWTHLKPGSVQTSAIIGAMYSSTSKAIYVSYLYLFYLTQIGLTVMLGYIKH